MFRGRGRLHLEEGLVTPPRRPGEPPSPGTSSPVHLLIPLFMGPTDDLAVFNAIHAYLQAANSPTDIDKFIETIFTRILKDASNSDHIAKYVWIASKHRTSGGEMIQRKFFSELEKQFADWSQLAKARARSEEYRNFVRFFSGVVHFTRKPSLAPFDDLINATYLLMEPLADSNDTQDLSLLSLCLIRYFKYLKMVSSDRKLIGDVDRLTISIRKKIEARGEISEEAACWLLLALEARQSGFDSLSEPVKLHYASLLGQSVYSLGVKSEAIKIPRIEAGKYMLDSVEPSNLILI